MDKGRHPQVIRTWKVERTKTLTRPPQSLKAQRKTRQQPGERGR
jgi:hypothetical protein